MGLVFSLITINTVNLTATRYYLIAFKLLEFQATRRRPEGNQIVRVRASLFQVCEHPAIRYRLKVFELVKTCKSLCVKFGVSERLRHLIACWSNKPLEMNNNKKWGNLKKSAKRRKTAKRTAKSEREEEHTKNTKRDAVKRRALTNAALPAAW